MHESVNTQLIPRIQAGPPARSRRAPCVVRSTLPWRPGKRSSSYLASRQSSGQIAACSVCSSEHAPIRARPGKRSNSDPEPAFLSPRKHHQAHMRPMLPTSGFPVRSLDVDEATRSSHVPPRPALSDPLLETPRNTFPRAHWAEELFGEVNNTRHRCLRYHGRLTDNRCRRWGWGGRGHGSKRPVLRLVRGQKSAEGWSRIDNLAKKEHSAHQRTVTSSTSGTTSHGPGKPDQSKIPSCMGSPAEEDNI